MDSTSSGWKYSYIALASHLYQRETRDEPACMNRAMPPQEAALSVNKYWVVKRREMLRIQFDGIFDGTFFSHTKETQFSHGFQSPV